MYQSVEPLNVKRHADYRYTPMSGYTHAKNTNIVPLCASELARAAMCYPIVFPAEGSPVPQAVLSLRKGDNFYVDQNGRWRAPYIPAYIRQYPFILGKDQEQDRYLVCIDIKAPHFQGDNGQPLFTSHGEKTEILNKAEDFLTRYQKEHLATERLVEGLAEAGILTPKKITIDPRGQNQTIGGFRGIVPEASKELQGEVLKEWHQNGLLGIIYAHLFSQVHFTGLAQHVKANPDN